MRLLPDVRPLRGAALRRRRQQQRVGRVRREPRLRQARRCPGGETEHFVRLRQMSLRPYSSL